MIESVLDVICNLYPNIHRLVRPNPHLASVSIPDLGTTPSFIDDLCHTALPLDFKSAVSVATTRGLTRPSTTNRFPIVDILFLISVDIVFNRLSKVRLLGRYDADNPHTFKIFLL